MNEKKCVKVSVPLLTELKYRIGKLDFGNNVGNIARYHLPVYKSRALIKLLPDVIAMPSKSPRGNVIIISKESFFSNDEVQRSIAELDIELSRSFRVTRELYKACLEYTISLKIGLSWNAIDTAGYYLRGKDFLTTRRRPKDAVKLVITVTDQGTRFLVQPARINLPRLTLWHCNLRPQAIAEFMEDDEGVIDFGVPDHWKWVYMLPSMKRSRAMKVTKKIAETSPIETYQQMKEHWQNMYDFRLPETEEGMIYFLIWFPWAPKGWSFPYHCLSPIPGVTFRLDNTRATAETFLEKLLDEIPTVCGNDLTLEEVGGTHPCITLH